MDQEEIQNIPQEMTDTANMADNEQLAENPTEDSAAHSRNWRLMVAIGFICTLAAWLLMVWSGVLSAIFAGVGLVFSSVGVGFVGKGVWRNLAITAIIAAAVLLLVYALFFFGLRFVVNQI